MNLASKQTIKALLKERDIEPLKRLGQSFLIDSSVLNKIISAANLSKKDIVLEIGPGLGVLTVELAKRAKKVIAVEKDKKLCEILDARNARNVRIVNQDILTYKLQATSYKLIANLPYYITSPVIRKFLESDKPPELMALLIQKEVAQRICARPPKMSILAIAVQFYADAKIISYVSRKSFWPQPKVDSAIIKIEPRNKTELSTTNTEKFFKLVKSGFSSKRKFLINNLSRELKIENCKLKIVFDQIELGQKLRAENLSIEQWLKLLKML